MTVRLFKNPPDPESKAKLDAEPLIFETTLPYQGLNGSFHRQGGPHYRPQSTLGAPKKETPSF